MYIESYLVCKRVRITAAEAHGLPPRGTCPMMASALVHAILVLAIADTRLTARFEQLKDPWEAPALRRRHGGQARMVSTDGTHCAVSGEKETVFFS